MKLLLDTQVALWWLAGSARLKAPARARIGAASCQLSVASIWEVAIKHALGKLPIAPQDFRDGLAPGAGILPITDHHAIATARLPAGHADPFDRLLLATAQVEKLQLLTVDAALLRFAETLGGIAVAMP